MKDRYDESLHASVVVPVPVDTVALGAVLEKIKITGYFFGESVKNARFLYDMKRCIADDAAAAALMFRIK